MIVSGGNHFDEILIHNTACGLNVKEMKEIKFKEYVQEHHLITTGKETRLINESMHDPALIQRSYSYLNINLSDIFTNIIMLFHCAYLVVTEYRKQNGRLTGLQYRDTPGQTRAY